MAKIADKYFITEPWQVVEKGFNPEYAMTSESVFSLGNEYMGVRGYFEEGYSGERLLGSYFNGIYERRQAEGQHYKGIIDTTEFLVNSVDWLYVRIRSGAEELDLNKSSITDFMRELDFKTGLLTRSFIWHTQNGDIGITFERLISMTNITEAAQRITFRSVSFDGDLEVVAGLDFDTVHDKDKKYWDCSGGGISDRICHIKGRTQGSGLEAETFCIVEGTITDTFKASEITRDKKAAIAFSGRLTSGEETVLTKCVINYTSAFSGKAASGDTEKRLRNMSFDGVLSDNEAWWQDVWNKSDIEITGDDANQQGIRFCIFQMFQTFHGAVAGANIGAKGLTGEAYNGNAFWDTETYCLPFYLFHDRQSARNLLYFRYATLDDARERAKSLDCKGAFYPIATISGKECCSLWQHASLQLQASTGVAYGIWCYEKVTGDKTFNEEYGLEMLIEICRMLATRGDYNESGTRYGYYCVMGPDEFQMMVNHNCYTNYMARFTFLYTIEVMNRIAGEKPELFNKLAERLSYETSEAEDWQKKADKMYIPFNEERRLFEQHEGYFDLPHIDVDAIPVGDFPLYNHWSYDRIYRNDMIKQPDVLMFLLLFNSSFSQEVIKANYDYYEPRCIHESSLSPSAHSILAQQLGLSDDAYEFFRFATRMDLDNYNRNTQEGLHTTSIAAAWMNIVYGFGGLRSDGEILSLNPGIPDKWEGYNFRIVYNDDVLCVSVDRDYARLHTLNGSNINVRLYGRQTTIDGSETRVALAKAVQSGGA